MTSKLEIYENISSKYAAKLTTSAENFSKQSVKYWGDFKPNLGGNLRLGAEVRPKLKAFKLIFWD